MFEPYSAMAARKNNPLLKVDLDASNTEWGMHDSLLEQMTDVAIDPSDGAEHLMRGVAISVSDVQFSKSEQFVTYIDGRMQKETVYWDSGLQIYYWQSQRDNAWYFEDPYNDDVITKAGSYNKLLKKLERRQFWWLETDEDVSVTRKPDGSKGYTYKGLYDPIQITTLLAEEAQQEQITSDRPAPKWKAAALSAMTLLGHAMGVQSLAKSYVSVAEPKQPELPGADTTTDTLKLLHANAFVEHKQSAHTGSANYFERYPFAGVEYLSQAIVSALPFLSIATTGAASVVHPRPARGHSMLGFSKLFTLLATMKSTDGHMIAEASEESFSPQSTAVPPSTETFSHVFTVPTVSDDFSLFTPPPLTYPSPDSEAIDKVTPFDIPGASFSGQAEPLQAFSQKMISRPEEPSAQSPLAQQPPSVNTETGHASLALSPVTQVADSTLSNTMKMVDDTLNELERCTREVEKNIIAKDEKSTQEKINAIQLLNKLGIALSGTCELLKKAENLPNNVADEEISYQIKMLDQALVDLRAYLTTQAQDLSLTDQSDLKAAPAAGISFLSTVSAAIADIDSKTVGIILGVLGAFGLGSVAAYMMMRKGGSTEPGPEQGYGPMRLRDENSRGSRVSPYPQQTSIEQELNNVEEALSKNDLDTAQRLISNAGMSLKSSGGWAQPLTQEAKEALHARGAALAALIEQLKQKSSATIPLPRLVPPLEQLKNSNVGITFETCQDIVVGGDAGVKIYFFSAFYRINQYSQFNSLLDQIKGKEALNLNKPIAGLKSNIGKGVIYFGSKDDMCKWPLIKLDPLEHKIDSGSLTQVIRKVKSLDMTEELRELPAAWSYERNAAYWCGAMAARRVFKSFGAFPAGTDELIDRLKSKPYQAGDTRADPGGVEGDELLWLRDNKHTVAFDSGLNPPGHTLQLSPPSLAASSTSQPSASIDGFYIGYYSYTAVKAGKKKFYETPENQKAVADRRNKRIDELITTIKTAHSILR